MKLLIDFPEIDLKFMRKTYKGTGCSFIPLAIQNECVEAVYNGAQYEERKTGKWNGYRCSECKKICTGNIRGCYDIVHKPNYCPNCGVKMED